MVWWADLVCTHQILAIQRCELPLFKAQPWAVGLPNITKISELALLIPRTEGLGAMLHPAPGRCSHWHWWVRHHGKWSDWSKSFCFSLWSFIGYLKIMNV